jgi:hypothetical protein
VSLVLPLVPLLVALSAPSGPPAEATAARPPVPEARLRVAAGSPEASLDRMLREIARDRSAKDAPSTGRSGRSRPTPAAETPAVVPEPAAKPAEAKPAAPIAAPSGPPAASEVAAHSPAHDRTPAPAASPPPAKDPAPPSAAPGESVGKPLDLASGTAVGPALQREAARPAPVPDDLLRPDRLADDPPPIGGAPPRGWHDALRDRPPPALPGFLPPAPTSSKPAAAPAATIGAEVPNIAVLATDQRNIFPLDVLQKLQAIHLLRKGAN